MTRICITGGPRTGKTTLASDIERCGVSAGLGTLQRPARWVIRHTDDLIGSHDWSDASAEVARWFDTPGPWIIEGVAVSRALRKWHDQHPGEPPPVDQVIYLHTPYVTLSKGQGAMAKGVAKVHSEIEPWLRRHRVFTAHQYVANLGEARA